MVYDLRQKPIKRPQQRSIVPLHNDCRRENQRKRNRLGVESERFSNRHAMLAVRGGLGVGVLRGDVRVDDRHAADVLVVDAEHAIVAVLDLHDGGLAAGVAGLHDEGVCPMDVKVEGIVESWPEGVASVRV
jgi:hypothetical protein